MKAIVPVICDEEAERNISNLFTLRTKREITRKELSQLTGVDMNCLYRVEKEHSQITINNYNKLAKFFGWKKILISRSKRANEQYLHRISQDFPPSEELKLTIPAKIRFEEGHSYHISEKVYTDDNRGGNNRQLAHTAWGDDYVFRYEGKQGIHHVFREIRGNWTRTYTDAQLIGKKVKEVER